MRNLKKIAILTYEGVPAYELSCALEIFALPRKELDKAYHCDAIAVDAKQVSSTGGIRISVNKGLDCLDQYGTIVVPGWPLQRKQIPSKLAKAVHDLLENKGRLIAICSGAFLLAELGLLDHKKATTHWQYADEFVLRFPKVLFQKDVIYTQDEPIYTSAGSSAGLDLCLEIVRQDFGHHKANKVARRLVMPPHRTGGQAQYIEQPIAVHGSKFATALNWAIEHIDQGIQINDLANEACLSRRSFDRQFRSSMGTSPKRWLTQARISRACELLESTGLDIEHISVAAGFDKAINLRHHFKLEKGITPSQYRQQFGAYSASRKMACPNLNIEIPRMK